MINKYKIKFENILKIDLLDIITFTIYLLALITFQTGYIKGFSICGTILFLMFFIVLFLTRHTFKEEFSNMWKNKYKRIMTYTYGILALLALIIAITIIIINPVLTRGMSIVIITILMSVIFIVYVSNNILKNVILTIFTIGWVFSITTNFNHAVDEKKHFMTAFNIAFGNFNYATSPITDDKVEAIPHLTRYTEIDEYLKETYKPELIQNEKLEDVPSTPATYNFVSYLFPAFGIFIANLLGGSIIDLYIMGRIFNLIQYAILVGIAIKLIPYKKNIFAVIFLMPISLILAGTYSIDGFCIGIVSVLIAYCLKIKNEEKTISLKEFIIIIGLFLLSLFAKSMAYVLVSAIFLMLPIKKTIQKNKKYVPIMIIGGIISVVILSTLALKIKNTQITSDTRGGTGINTTEQIDYVLKHPLFDVVLALNQIKNTLLNPEWYQMLHEPKFFTEDAKFVLMPLMLFILYVALTENDYSFKVKDKIIMLIAFFLVFGMTSMVLYISFTAVGALNIGGYQTRYIIPIMALPLFCLSNDNLLVKNKNYRNIRIACLSSVFIIIGIMQAILVK